MGADNQNNDNGEVYEDELQYWLDRYCEKWNIENPEKMPDNKWGAAMEYLGEKMFYDTDRLKAGNVYSGNLKYNNNYNCNAYDKDKVWSVLCKYSRLCKEYDKVVGLIDFSSLTGITTKTLYEWEKDKGEGKWSHSGCDIFQKIMQDEEYTLANRDGLKDMAKLNAKHGWRGEQQKVNVALEYRNVLPPPGTIAAKYRPELSDNNGEDLTEIE